MIYKMVQFNQMSVSALVNGSLVIAVICLLNVRNHGIAVRAKLLPHQVLKGEALDRFLKEHDLGPAKKPKTKSEGKKKR